MKKLSNRLTFLTIFLALTFIFQSCEQKREKRKEQNIVYGTGNPSDWPKDQDAVIAASKNHKILLENDKVRVLEVSVAPKEVEALHHHQWPSVLYITELGDFIDRDAEGNIIEDSRKIDEPIVLPFTMWKEPEAPHSVENLSDSIPLKLIRIELKQ